jgi:hypothetical protein
MIFTHTQQIASMTKATQFEKCLNSVMYQFQVAQVDLSHEVGQVRVEIVFEGALGPNDLVALEAFLGNRGGNVLGGLLEVLQLEFKPISNAESLDLMAFAVERAEDVFGERGCESFDDSSWAEEESRVLFGYLCAVAGLCTRETTAFTKKFESMHPEDGLIRRAYKYGRRLSRDYVLSNVVLRRGMGANGEEEEEGYVVNERFLDFNAEEAPLYDVYDALRTVFSGFAGEEGKRGGEQEAYRRYHGLDCLTDAVRFGVMSYLLGCDLVRMVADCKEERERREKLMEKEDIDEIGRLLGGGSGDSVALRLATALYRLIDTVGHRGQDGEFYERLVVIKDGGNRTTDNLTGRAGHSRNVFKGLWSVAGDESGFNNQGGIVVKGENGLRVPFTTFLARLVLWIGEKDGRLPRLESWLLLEGHTVELGLDRDGVAGNVDGTGGSSRWRFQQELERRLKDDILLHTPWWNGLDNSSFDLPGILNLCVEGNVDGDVQER